MLFVTPGGVTLPRSPGVMTRLSLRWTLVVLLTALPLLCPARASADPTQSCSLDDASGNPPGFYRTDKWKRGEVVLTFDDGPHPGHTPKVLDLLAKYPLPATFFLVGRNINSKTYPLVQRMVADGHTLGLHSYNHDVKMAVRKNGERSIEYIRGQNETTQILVDLALLAQSEADFDAMYTRVFEKKSGRWLEASSLRKDWRMFAERDAALLKERGYSDGKRPYTAVFTRPPAGTPYVGGSDATQKKLYAEALSRGGWLNVLWNGESGDTNPTKKHDFAFLTSNLRLFSKRGGVLLIHDYVRKDALRTALAAMVTDDSIDVVPIDQAVGEKFGCGPAAVLTTLRAAPDRPAVAAAPAAPGGRS
jgi:peptidoglycan/xylan/chitin deacetylase (PgdA/CDA1 family)